MGATQILTANLIPDLILALHTWIFTYLAQIIGNYTEHDTPRKDKVRQYSVKINHVSYGNPRI